MSNKCEDKTLKEMSSEEIRAKLNEPGSGKPSFEEFKTMVYEDRKSRSLKGRIKRIFKK